MARCGGSQFIHCTAATGPRLLVWHKVHATLRLSWELSTMILIDNTFMSADQAKVMSGDA